MGMAIWEIDISVMRGKGHVREELSGGWQEWSHEVGVSLACTTRVKRPMCPEHCERDAESNELRGS